MTEKEKIIGIDLGTTFSCGALVRGGRPEVLLNAEGERITPSAVAFTDGGEVLVGQLARRQAVLNPTRTVLSVKRKMGTDWRFRVKVNGREEEYTPEQISAFILQKIKRDAEELLGTKITKAVITVPAYFNNLQRQATKDAGKIAGLEVLRIINEPTAAALAYGLDKNKDQKILVYDLGGGTFDVSILDIGEGVFEVVASDGDTQLGGDDFDRRIADWLVEEFKAETGIDVRGDPQAMQRLRDAAEAAKKDLSSRMEARISLPYLSADAKGPKHLERTLTRAKFEAMISDYLERTMRIVDSALSAAKLSAKDIDQVVLVGGSTRIPKVQELVAEVFGKAKVNKDINPDEVVALGAAIQAAVLAGDMQSLVLLDVTPLTLSIETLGGVATPLIERNTTIPVEKTKTFTTADDFQTQVEIHVVQGERKMAADNKSLGRFQLTDLPPAPRGVPQIDVTFQIDADGILNVTAKDKATGKSASIEIKETSRLTEAEIERMRKDAEEHAEEDRRRVEEVETRNQADTLLHTVEKTLGELGDKVPAAKRGEVEAAIRSLREKLDGRADTGAIRAGMEELRRLAGEVAAAAYQGAGQATQTDNGGPTPGRGDYIPYDKEDKE
ncbi:MAG: molecular chaperone DnaK [Candidatus Bipolaricaulis sp.]|uniref:Chaperone protein DnaK n=1 Tax=Candidatus Bipolaricaulis anaerobius TaxID=2026885 RepID=A0A2X3KYQ6_9BACT|nr:molecular chaperone DnaK [Candidatus Bipolaricaulis anaerobius]MBP7726562.1 molecular chaperone DnaK [Candidatus Bipolaricaulis sp.]SQD92089.1 chaperone Hsp70, co-chaperone with DnaJ [Candidatus Bipolaricaulis anaerobius]